MLEEPAKTRIRCITFDLDDTLWECGSVIRGAEIAFYDWIVEHYPRITEHYDRSGLVAHRQAYFSTLEGSRHNLTVMRKQWLAYLANETGYGEELVEDGFSVFWTHRNAVTLYDEVPAALASLRGRYLVGVITNGNADVHHIGVGHYFDFVITAAGAGVAKPDAAIFEAALAAANVRADQALHVGDDATTDILGAMEAGMHTVWVNPGAKPWPHGPTPSATISTLDELSGVLNTLG